MEKLGDRRGGGRLPHFMWSIYRGGIFFLEPELKWAKNRLRMVFKVRNVRLGVFSGGGCHHPNIVFQPPLNGIMHQEMKIAKK